LVKIGWEPSNNSELALYHAARQEWNELPGMGKDAIEILLDVLKYDDSAAREIAVESLGKIGDSRVIEPLINALEDEAYRVRREAKDALQNIHIRTLTDDFNFICDKCFLRYKKHKASYKYNIFFVETIDYSACPGCHSDSYFFVGIKKVVLLVDHNFGEVPMKDGETLIVNWFKRKEPFDYDEIWIKAAENFEVEELVMKLRNDMDNERRKRLPDTSVYISPNLKLSQAKMNLLKDNFQVKIKKI
jgi:hypothetical protein